MKAIIAMSFVLAAAQCGLREEYAEGDFRLTIQDTIEVEEGQTSVLILTVINASSQVTFSVSELPSFATLESNKLTFKPRRLFDAGDYPLEITATDGTNTDTTQLVLHVPHENTAPEMTFPALSNINQEQCNESKIISDACDPPFVKSSVSDPERDSVRMEVEIVPFGQPLTGTATISSAFRNDYNEYNYMNECLTMPGLVQGTKYRVALRWVEQNGLASPWKEFCRLQGYEYPGLQ